MRWLGCEKKREISGISQKCYFFIHFPILELASKRSADAPSQRIKKRVAPNYQTTTDEQADSFIKRWLTLDQDKTQLRVKFIPEFERVISHKKTAMFFQIDRRVSMMIELQLASQVPLLKP